MHRRYNKEEHKIAFMKSSKLVDTMTRKGSGNAHIGRSGEIDKEEDELIDDVGLPDLPCDKVLSVCQISQFRLISRVSRKTKIKWRTMTRHQPRHRQARQQQTNQAKLQEVAKLALKAKNPEPKATEPKLRRVARRND